MPSHNFLDAEWAGYALRARRRGEHAIEGIAELIARETYQRVCDEVHLDWYLKTHFRDGSRIGKGVEEMDEENVCLLPDKEEAGMYP